MSPPHDTTKFVHGMWCVKACLCVLLIAWGPSNRQSLSPGQICRCTLMSCCVQMEVADLVCCFSQWQLINTQPVCPGIGPIMPTLWQSHCWNAELCKSCVWLRFCLSYWRQTPYYGSYDGWPFVRAYVAVSSNVLLVYMHACLMLDLYSCVHGLYSALVLVSCFISLVCLHGCCFSLFSDLHLSLACSYIFSEYNWLIC